MILICTNGGLIRVLNAFNGSELHTFSVRDTHSPKDLGLTVYLPVCEVSDCVPGLC